MQLRFGLGEDGETRTLAEIGKALDLSHERIRQLLERIVSEKLPQCGEIEELRESWERGYLAAA